MDKPTIPFADSIPADPMAEMQEAANRVTKGIRDRKDEL
jgi:hypothetical protein